MKKMMFKLGAALTAAIMVCSASAAMVFADEVEDVQDVQMVQEEVELEPVTAEDVAALEAKVDDVATGSVITIGDITVTADETYYSIAVPFTIDAGEAVPTYLSFFAYDITQITGDQNNQVGYSAETPISYINQYDGQASGTFNFKVRKSAGYTDDSILVIKVGGTGIDTPDAKSVALATESPYPCGDVDHSEEVDAQDALLVIQYAFSMIEDDDLFLEEADAYQDGSVDAQDALVIIQYAFSLVDELPVIPE